jgi:Uncharacterized protein conserved in bacteria
MRKVVTFLWLNDRADEAVNLYVSLFDDAKILRTSYLTEAVAEAAGMKGKLDLSELEKACRGE